MKKHIFLACLLAVASFATLAACGENKSDKHNFVLHEATAADCVNEGNDAYYTCDHCDKIYDAQKQEIAEIPSIPALGHNYVYQAGQAGTCSEKGVVAHFLCGDCNATFDAAKNEISSVEGALDATNHSSSLSISIAAQPTKTEYSAGETFDPTGMVVVSQCADCAGFTIGNQLLTFEYQTGANAFANGDSKVTVKYQNWSQDVAISVSQKQAQILGAADSYATTCGVAPLIEATTDVSGTISVAYFDGETEITPADLKAGKTYTAKLTVEATDDYLGAEKLVEITVAHAHDWKADEEDWKKLGYECTCGDKANFYLLDYQAPYVDANHLAIDLSKFVVGTENFSITSVQQIVRMKDGKYELDASKGDLVDIEYTVDDAGYSFALANYERPNGDETPYILTLSVTYNVEGIERVLIVEAKWVDLIITTAEELAQLAYTGDPNDEGGEAKNGYYVLGKDIDASGVEITGSTPCFKEASGFIGTFDGNGYTISNLKITGGQGLFGALGYHADVQNVTFENVYVAHGLYALAFCARKASFTNVAITFSETSQSYLVAYSANECTFTNVSILTNKNAGAPFLIDEKAENTIPASVEINYFAFYTVTFNSNGGSEVAPIAVLQGKKLEEPATPVKTSEDYDYNFLGWFLNETDETPFDFNSEITGDFTLIAKWQQTEKSNAVLNANSQTLTKWDYGNAITTQKGVDDTYGNIWKITVDDVDEQSMQHTAIDTTGYETIYFYVFNPQNQELRLVIHGGWSAWGRVSVKLTANAWTKVEVPVSVFTEDDAGKIFLVLQSPSPETQSLAGEWKITSFYGLKAGESAPEYTSNILLDANSQTLTKWDYGNAITVQTGKDDTYGDLWTITIDDVAEQSFQHIAIDTKDYKTVCFYVYNPQNEEMRLTIHGGWSAWGRVSVKLAANAWTKVEVPASVFTEDDAGKIFLVLQTPTPETQTLAGEWKITSFYGVDE